MVAVDGAINSLVAEIIADHIRMRVADPGGEHDAARARQAEELICVVQSYLK